MIELKENFEKRLREELSKPYTLDFKKRRESEEKIDFYKRKLSKIKRIK